MDKVQKLTYAFFGEVLGHRLLDSKQIVPHRWDKQTKTYVPAAKWAHEDGHYCNRQSGNYDVLAVICGPTSDINVLDIDDMDSAMLVESAFSGASASTVTKRGGHYYFHNNESMPIQVKWFNEDKHVADYQSTAHLAKFSGQQKEGECIFIDDQHEQLIAAMDETFSRRKNNTSKAAAASSYDISEELLAKSYENESISDYLSEITYECEPMSVVHLWENKQVGRWSLEKDLEKVEEKFISQIKKMKKGERNTKLNRLAFESYRLGLDIARIREAAYEVSGEDWTSDEADAVIDHAAGSFDDEHSRTLDERVMVWHAIVRPQVRSGHTTVGPETVDTLAAMAVKDHDYQPQLNVQRFQNRTSLRKGTINQKLQHLVKLGFLIKVHSNKPRCPHNYQLALKGVPIQQMDKSIDSWLGNGQIELLWHEAEEDATPISLMNYDHKRDGEGYANEEEKRAWLEEKTRVQEDAHMPIPASLERISEPQTAGEGKHTEDTSNNRSEPTAEAGLSVEVIWWNHIVKQKPETQYLIDADEQTRYDNIDSEAIMATLHNLANDSEYKRKVNEWKTELASSLTGAKLMEYRENILKTKKPGELEKLFLTKERILEWSW